ncbi:MAG: DUF1801 domain-containing protein [Chloroflexi bacterium]|nr:DUF1801 domain-containing protein [Chloroflexota bacterium]
MDDSKAGFKSIDEYIATFSPEEQAVLQKLRQTVHAAAPDAVEAISYQMPTFKLNGNLVHFAVAKNHYGFYPAPSGIAAFEKDVAPYFAGKGSLNFPKDKPIPYDLVTRIVEYRVQENLAKAKKKKG